MKAAMLFTGSGPVVILTTFESINHPKLIEKLESKGIDKFIAHEVPVEVARERYGGHFTATVNDLHETDDLRVLDYNGQRAFQLFKFSELGKPIMHEPRQEITVES